MASANTIYKEVIDLRGGVTNPVNVSYDLMSGDVSCKEVE